ncbi:Diaminopimelate epimerase [bioreactor metagenome]|uniref:Diaminopimelate epimerase n=1 Tax=bioreactor metagenome TaxID=1076179 RepID=A0A645JN15_9ZZZZ
MDGAKYGPILERAPIFPKRANISFAQMRSATQIRLRVWERGIGETRSCGTAACATAAAAVRLGFSPRNRDIQINLPGGQIIIHLTENGLKMTGDAQRDFEGIIEV